MNAVSTLTVGSTIAVDQLSTNSTTARQVNYSTLTGSTIQTNTLAANSTITSSTVYATDQVSTNQLVFSSITMTANTILEFTGPITSSILININGTMWKIPLQLA
jgi:hypothetical protein